MESEQKRSRIIDKTWKIKLNLLRMGVEENHWICYKVSLKS